MNIRFLFCRFTAGVLLTAAPLLAGAQQGADGAPVRVYDATELNIDAYAVIRRIWADSYHSSLLVPAKPDSGAAISGLLEEARRAGADGVVNLHCLQETAGLFARTGYFCYGNAIRIRGATRAR